MTICTASGSLPEHQYVWVDRAMVRTGGDRLAILPTNDLLFIERSFTVDQGWPRLKRQSEVYSCENGQRGEA